MGFLFYVRGNKEKMSHAKPTELKRALGNPGKRKLPDQNKVTLLPQISSQAPAHLTKAQKTKWTEIRTLAPWIAVTDEPLLTSLIEKMTRQKKLSTELKKSTFVLYTDKGYAYANPLFGMLSTIETEIFKLLCQLGLTPVDRSKMGVAEVKARTKLEELLSQKRDVAQ
jgi:P27 family predicted phage terminase small subunit